VQGVLTGGLLLAATLLLCACGGIDVRRGEVLVLRADSIVNPVMARYIDRGIDGAERGGAGAVVIELDTPGGLGSSMREIVQRIQRARVPVIVYVAPEGAQAASAGTFITLAGHVAAMAPGTNIGAASPIDISGEELEGTAGRKAENDAVAFIRSIAEQRGRNADWAERAVRDAVAASAAEAERENVVDFVAPNRAALLARVDGRAVTLTDGPTTLRTAQAGVREVSPSLGERVLDLLSDPNIAFMLLSIGGLAIMLELFHPGTLVPGVVGVLCLVLAFFALGTLPANWTALILIGLAFAFFAAEALMPGFGLLAAAGGISLALGGLFLVDAEGPLPTVSFWLSAGTAAAFAAFFAFALSAAVKARARPAEARIAESFVGREAVTVSALEPDGYVLINGERWAARSLGPAVPQGDRVTVTRQEGLRLGVLPRTLLTAEEGPETRAIPPP
jgi:membrane-bound serine protease (ClpP class)